MFNVNELRHQIEALVRGNPDLEEDEQLRSDMLEGATDINGVITALLHAIDANEFLINGLNIRLNELAARRERFKHRVAILRSLILLVLQSANLKKVEVAEATVSQRNAQPQIVGALDPELLPDDLVRIVREPNKSAIREALNNHRDVPGVFLSNAPPYLAISTK